MREKHICPECGCEMVLSWRKGGRKARGARVANLRFDLGLKQREKVLKALGASPWRRDRRSAEWAGFAILDALGLSRENVEDGLKARNLIRDWLADGTLEEFLSQNDSRQIKPFLRVPTATSSNLFA
jgi:hypothetical protein